jgi:hypothetical protein
MGKSAKAARTSEHKPEHKRAATKSKRAAPKVKRKAVKKKLNRPAAKSKKKLARG